MHVAVVVIGAWFAVSIPVALACCALLRTSPPERTPVPASSLDATATVVGQRR